MLRRSVLTLMMMGMTVGLARAADDELPAPQPVPQPALQSPFPSGPTLPPPRLATPFPVAPVFPPPLVPRQYNGPVMPPRHTYQPPPPPYLYPPPVLYRVSAYQVWQNHSVNMLGQWRARVLSTNEGSWYNGNGHPYYWSRTRMGEVMPWGPSESP